MAATPAPIAGAAAPASQRAISRLRVALGSAQWWLALSGPVLMLLFLYRLSGIPWTEAQSLRSRGDDYRRYQREVSAFIPLPPRRG